jgi:hypothetical protein
VQVIDSLSEITGDTPYGMVAMLCEENGKEVAAMPTDWRKMQLGIAKRLLLNHSIEQVRSYVCYRKTTWNGHEPFDLRKVEKDIGEWELSGSPAVAASRASPTNGHRPVTFAEQKDKNTDAAIDEVRALIEGSDGNGSRTIPRRDEAGRRRLSG